MNLQASTHPARERLIAENELPQLPADWKVVRFRFAFSESKERNGAEPVGDMLSVSEYRGVVPRVYDHAEQQRTAEELETYRVVRPGQLAVNTMWLNHLGLGVSDHLGHVSPAYAVYNMSDELDGRYAHHLLRSQFYLKIYMRYLYGIRPNSFQIKSDDWNSIPVLVPPLDTQKTIADFLDRETARIDQLIEKKEAMRQVVEERLRASIACAVTSCDAEESQPLRRYCKVVTGKTPSRAEESNFSQEVGMPWATPSDLGFLTPIGSTKEQITETGMVGMPSVPSGTTLVNGIGASVGKVGIAGVELTFNQQIHALFQRTASFDDRYLFFAMLMRKDEIVSMASNTTIPIINSERLGRLVLARPTMETQQRVRSKLDAEATRARQLEHKLETSIVGLRQYRTSLITAAVTGQIDVTTWGKQGSTDRRLDQIEEEMSA